jgi:hypothetical protein
MKIMKTDTVVASLDKLIYYQNPEKFQRNTKLSAVRNISVKNRICKKCEFFHIFLNQI